MAVLFAERSERAGSGTFRSSARCTESTEFTGGGNSYVRSAQWCTDDELDVRFYLCDQEQQAAGLRSNWSMSCEAMQLGFSHVDAPTDPDASMVDRLDSAARARRVHRAMTAVGAEHAAVLSAAYGGDVAPREVRVRWGDELALVVLARCPDAAARTTGAGAGELGAEAQRALDDARASYARARSAR